MTDDVLEQPWAADMGFGVQFSGGILRTIVEHKMAA